MTKRAFRLRNQTLPLSLSHSSFVGCQTPGNSLGSRSPCVLALEISLSLVVEVEPPTQSYELFALLDRSPFFSSLAQTLARWRVTDLSRPTQRVTTAKRSRELRDFFCTQAARSGDLNRLAGSFPTGWVTREGTRHSEEGLPSSRHVLDERGSPVSRNMEPGEGDPVDRSTRTIERKRFQGDAQKEERVRDDTGKRDEIVTERARGEFFGRAESETERERERRAPSHFFSLSSCKSFFAAPARSVTPLDRPSVDSHPPPNGSPRRENSAPTESKQAKERRNEGPNQKWEDEYVILLPSSLRWKHTLRGSRCSRLQHSGLGAASTERKTPPVPDHF